MATDKQERRAALEDQIRTLIPHRNAAEGSARELLEQQIGSARRQLKALG